MLGEVALEVLAFLLVMFVIPTCLLGAWWISCVLIGELARWWGPR